MGDLATILPSYYGLNTRAVKERGCFLLPSAKIHKTESRPREIFARFNLLNKISDAGFDYAEKIIPNTLGAPFVALGRDVFVMMRHFRGHEPDMKNFDDVTLLIKSLASFHKIAREFDTSEINISHAPSLTDIFAKEKSALSAAVKQINRRPKYSDFDFLILKHADAYTARAEAAEKILSQTDYATLHAHAIKNNHICHNDLKEESFTISEGGCYIANFDNASIDLQLTDLASILRRYARKSREAPISELLKIYGEISPLPSSAEKIIYASLIFPWSFLKIVSNFYSKKRNFIPAATTSRMTAIIDEQDAFNAYVNELNTLGKTF